MTVAKTRNYRHSNLSSGLWKESMDLTNGMNKLPKRFEGVITSWLTDQELAVLIGLIVLIFVSWGIYPLLSR